MLYRSGDSEEETGTPWLKLLIAAMILVMVGYLAYSWWLSQNPGESVKVLEFSVTPSEISVAQNSTLKIMLENLDKRSHNVKLTFSADPSISFLKPGGESLVKEGSNFTYSFVLESVQSTTSMQFLVKGRLQDTVSFSGYPISLRVTADGRTVVKAWNDITLTVKRS